MLSLSDITELKREIKSRFGAELHFHDVCPRPYFTIEKTDKDIESFISEFLDSRKYHPKFSENHLQFTVKR